MAEPVEIVQGTTVEWSRAYGDYPPATHTLSYEFRSLNSALTVAAVSASGAWSVTITRAQTAALAVGVYTWQAFATTLDASERVLVDSGTLDVLPDLARIPDTDPATDQRTSARKRLQNYRAMLENVAYVKTLTPDQIEAMEKVMKSLEWDCKREADAEKLKRDGYPTRKIFTRFI